MENNDSGQKTFRERFLNKKVLIILVAFLIIVGAGAGVAVEKASDNPAFCQLCHIMKPYYQSWYASSLLANKHAQAGVTCHQCHESSIAIQTQEGIKFITGDYKTPLDKRNFGTRDFCLKCHSKSGGAEPFEQVKTKTNLEESNPHDSHNGEQNCNLCHSMHRQSKVMCAQCHQFSWMDKLDESWAK